MLTPCLSLSSSRADPNAFDWRLQLDVMTQLRQGNQRVAVPTYDFVTQCALSLTHATHALSPVHPTPAQ